MQWYQMVHACLGYYKPLEALELGSLQGVAASNGKYKGQFPVMLLMYHSDKSEYWQKLLKSDYGGDKNNNWTFVKKV